MIFDTAGNLYGTTYFGGPAQGSNGSLFKIAAGSNTITTLASFTGSNGLHPHGTLIQDAAGNLFGTTVAGGANNVGTVFELTADTNTLITLATFNVTNGSFPYGGLVADASGNLYGTTSSGGLNGEGTVFEITGAGFVVPEPGIITLCPIVFMGLIRRRRGARRDTTSAMDNLPSRRNVFKLLPVLDDRIRT